MNALSRPRFGLVVIGMIAVIAVTAGAREIARRYRRVDYAEARAVVNRRCLECHSERPSNRAFAIAPRGVMFDTASQMQQYAARIETRVAIEHTMPLANLSGMTDDERWVLSRWVATGARVP